MRLPLLLLFSILSLLSCSQKQKSDLLVYNATIYTIDSSFSIAEAMVVEDGKILAVGKLSDLQKNIKQKKK